MFLMIFKLFINGIVTCVAYVAPFVDNQFIVAEKEFHAELDKLLQVLGIDSPFYLVTQVCIKSHKSGIKLRYAMFTP